jgi:hypothetical protein
VYDSVIEVDFTNRKMANVQLVKRIGEPLNSEGCDIVESTSRTSSVFPDGILRRQAPINRCIDGVVTGNNNELHGYSRPWE